MVEREVEWDDEQTGRMMALMLVESRRCPCGCGLPLTVAHDGTRNFATTLQRCHARKWLDVERRDFEQNNLPPDRRDKDWKPGTPRPSDGVWWTVAEHVDPDPESQEVT